MMDAKRFVELEIAGGKLTTDEMVEGWFYCCDWDYMLINTAGDEAKFCSCLAKKRLKGEIK